MQRGLAHRSTPSPQRLWRVGDFSEGGTSRSPEPHGPLPYADYSDGLLQRATAHRAPKPVGLPVQNQRPHEAVLVGLTDGVPDATAV